jgi:DGQHR domain-containing protein
MTKNELVTKWGTSVRIPVLIGPNLNLTQVRSFAPLDFLADISGADVFDQVTNPEGTQRELKKAHAKEALEYAMGSLHADAIEDARAFTEVILNVRNTDFAHIEVEGDRVDLSHLNFENGNPIAGELILDLECIEYPSRETNPGISRVDGNHRLSSVEALGKRSSELSFPLISFAMFIGLSKEQELKVFSDINGKQQKMDTSHLSQILANQKGDKALLSDRNRGKWFARELSQAGMPFEGLVYMGGSRKGLKKRDGVTPPISFTGLTTMMNHTLKSMDEVIAKELNSEDCAAAAAGDKVKLDKLVRNARGIAALIRNYWVAVKETFPEAWNDKKKVEYLLFDSTGHVALSMLSGSIISKAVLDHKFEVEYFRRHLQAIREEGILLRKSQFPAGLAGLSGTKVVFEALIKAKDCGQSGLGAIISDLVPEAKSQLDG